MGIIATKYPASKMLEWDTGRSNLAGGTISDVDGNIIVYGWDGSLQKFTPDGTQIWDKQQDPLLNITGVAFKGDNTFFLNTITYSVEVVYHYNVNGDLISYHQRPGWPTRLGGLYAKTRISEPYIFLPSCEVSSPYRIRLGMYDYSTWYVKDDWLVEESGLVHSGVSGLYIDRSRTYAYVSFQELGVVGKFLLHTAGGEWYLERVWQYGVINGGTIVTPTGICVDETNGFVYVVSTGSPFSILVLDAATGALLWTWDSFHTYGTRTFENFDQNVEVAIDSLGDIYVVAHQRFVRKFKGFYDPLTHETLVITSPDAVKLWSYQFGPS